MESIHDRFKKVRLYLNLMQKDLAKKLGVNPSHISHIESGDIIPSEKILYQISLYYNINFDWIKTGKGKMTMRKDFVKFLDTSSKAILSSIEHEAMDGLNLLFDKIKGPEFPCNTLACKDAFKERSKSWSWFFHFFKERIKLIDTEDLEKLNATDIINDVLKDLNTRFKKS